MILKNILSLKSRASIERSLYEAIVAQARQQRFYADLAVPDTVDGRFDMITLHMCLVLERLRDGGEATEQLSQAVFDEMFRDMDRSLREMGVGDLSVGKKVRKMAEVFYGRAEAYETAFAALANDSIEPLKDVIARNIYTADKREDDVAGLAHYVVNARKHLASQPVGGIMKGNVKFLQPDDN